MLLPIIALLGGQPITDAEIDWEKEFGVEQRVPDPATGELPVDPYVMSNSNAGSSAFTGDRLALAFNGQDGIRRIVNRTVDLSVTDPRIADIFAAHDMVRLRRTLFEQLCFILNAGCNYSGRDMKAAHSGMGLRMADMNALVENLQLAMKEEGVPFGLQNRLLSKLAPMSREIVER